MNVILTMLLKVPHHWNNTCCLSGYGWKNRAVRKGFYAAQANNISAAWGEVAGNLFTKKQTSSFQKMNSSCLPLFLSLALSPSPLSLITSHAVSRPPPHPPLWWIICAVGAEMADWLLWQVLNTDLNQCTTSILCKQRRVPLCIMAQRDVAHTHRHILCPSSDDRLMYSVRQADGWIIGQCYLFN